MEDILDNSPRALAFPAAENGKRFANYIIDIIVFYVIVMALAFVAGVTGIVSGNEDFLYEEPSNPFLEVLFNWSVFVLYYTLMEGLFKGKTIGKMITKTRAVTEDYQKITFLRALGRSALRLVPFEAFSFFGSKPGGWHDQWSNTIVIEDEGWSENQYDMA